MIVTVSGWLYIVFSILALFGLKGVHGASEKLAVLVSIVFLVAVGVGLLRRLNWARWLMLGMSLLTWTLGPLAFTWKLVQYYRPGVWVGILIVVVLCSAYIWLNFKLFDYLNSDDGRFEFDTPETETHAVAKSAALQIAWGVLSTLLLKHGEFEIGRSSDADFAAMLEAAERLRAERLISSRETERAREAERRQADEAALAQAREQQQMSRVVDPEDPRARQRIAKAEEEFQRKTRELFERRVRDRSYTDAEFEADKKANERELVRSFEGSAGSSPRAYSESSRPPPSASERPPSVILKCRDASGAISFTQGYCPAGTTLVESPPAD